MGVAKIVWGLPIITDAERSAKRELFPYSRSLGYGGCMTPPNPPTEDAVWFCAACRKAESEWTLPPDENKDSPTLIW